MKQGARTLTFVAAAAVAVAVAAGTRYVNRPAELADFSDVGEVFYPDFVDPNAATSLRVASYNTTTGKTDVFSVEFKDGLWRIPSHHGYPADAKDRLSQVAASIIGVKRKSLVERTPNAQKQYKVLDPLKTDLTGTEGRGDRITLSNGDTVLADFIVGNKVERSENDYYIRRANEDRIYTADLGDFSVSTKFADWIFQDVLDIQTGRVREILINRYFVDEARGAVVSEDQIELSRTSGSTPWEMKGLDTSAKELKTADIGTLLTTLDSLKIVGVRPKPPALAAGLKGNGAISIDPLIMLDLQDKGYFISQGQFISNEGEVVVGTDEGVRYVLGFGEEFSGTDVEIEVGAAKPADAPAEEKPADGDAAAKPPAEGAQTSRYLFVMIHYDESLLGPPPVEPVKPQQPAAGDQPPGGEAPAANANGENAAPAETPYAEALKRYEQDLELYNLQKSQYEAQIEAGKKRVDDLNRRFADWYYVIGGDVYNQLKLKREDLVADKPPAEAPAEENAAPAGEQNPLQNLLNGINIPGMSPAGENNAAPPAGEQPAAPPGEQPSPPPEANNAPTAGEQPVLPPANQNLGAELQNPPSEAPPAGEAPPAVPMPEPTP